MAPLTWLDTGAVSSSPEAVKAEVAKLAYLRRLGADRIDLSAIPPERARQLAVVGRRSKPKDLRAIAPERRHPILLATVAGAYASILDEVVQMLDQALAVTSSRARAEIADRQLAAAEANAERLELLDEILDVALDDGLDDAAVGAGVRALGRDRLGGGGAERGGAHPARWRPPRADRGPLLPCALLRPSRPGRPEPAPQRAERDLRGGRAAQADERRGPSPRAP